MWSILGFEEEQGEAGAAVKVQTWQPRGLGLHDSPYLPTHGHPQRLSFLIYKTGIREHLQVVG